MAQEQGFTLLEVLIACIVIILGLVGIVNMQVGSQKRSFETHQSTLAGLYAQDLQARLNADTCYLSKKIEPENELNNFISNTPANEGLNDFIQSHKSKWHSQHFTDSKTSWKTSLEVYFDPSSTTASDKAEQITDKGYWEFELTINPTNTQEDAIKQRFIVRYKEGGC